MATIGTFLLLSRFSLLYPFTLEALGVKKATAVPRIDWIPLCLSPSSLLNLSCAFRPPAQCEHLNQTREASMRSKV